MLHLDHEYSREEEAWNTQFNGPLLQDNGDHDDYVEGETSPEFPQSKTDIAHYTHRFMKDFCALEGSK
jgi:hypothetical protein